MRAAYGTDIPSAYGRTRAHMLRALRHVRSDTDSLAHTNETNHRVVAHERMLHALRLSVQLYLHTHGASARARARYCFHLSSPFECVCVSAFAPAKCARALCSPRALECVCVCLRSCVIYYRLQRIYETPCSNINVTSTQSDAHTAAKCGEHTHTQASYR